MVENNDWHVICICKVKNKTKQQKTTLDRASCSANPIYLNLRVCKHWKQGATEGKRIIKWTLKMIISFLNTFAIGNIQNFSSQDSQRTIPSELRYHSKLELSEMNLLHKMTVYKIKSVYT